MPSFLFAFVLTGWISMAALTRKQFYRFRTGDLRIYFELLEDKQTLYAHYILQQHTLADFVFRFKLPFKEETAIEQEDNFWKYLESLKK